MNNYTIAQICTIRTILHELEDVQSMSKQQRITILDDYYSLVFQRSREFGNNIESVSDKQINLYCDIEKETYAQKTINSILMIKSIHDTWFLNKDYLNYPIYIAAELTGAFRYTPKEVGEPLFHFGEKVSMCNEILHTKDFLIHGILLIGQNLHKFMNDNDDFKNENLACSFFEAQKTIKGKEFFATELIWK